MGLLLNKRNRHYDQISEFNEIKYRFKGLCREAKRYIKLHYSLWLLAHVFHKKPIKIHIGNGNPEPLLWMDIHIEVPTLLGHRQQWICNVDSLDFIFYNYSFEELHTHIMFHRDSNGDEVVESTKEFLFMKPKEFWKWMEDNAQWILKHPMIEYDKITTSQSSFIRNSAVNYAKMWLKKWFPLLADRQVLLVES